MSNIEIDLAPTTEHAEQEGLALFEQEISEFGKLITNKPRAFKWSPEIFILEPYYNTKPEAGFRVTYILSGDIDVKKFLKDKEAGKPVWNETDFDMIVVAPLNETPVRRLAIYTNQVATLQGTNLNLDVHVRPYVHRPGADHYGSAYTIVDNYEAAEYLSKLRNLIETETTEIPLE